MPVFYESDFEHTPDGLSVLAKDRVIKLELGHRQNKIKYDVHFCRELIRAEAIKRGWITDKDKIFLNVSVHDHGVLGSASWRQSDALVEDEIRFYETPAWRRG